jgi:hypothetical protein
VTATFRRILAFALAIAVLFVVPSLASAAEFEVDSTGDETTTTACETGVGACTLRGAIAAANAESTLDEITFGPAFDGGPGSTIALTSSLSILQPVKVLDSASAGVPDVNLHVAGTAITISNTATGTVVKGLGIEATAIGIQILGEIGAKVIDNSISGAQAAIEVNPGSVNSGGNLIEGNVIHVPAEFKFGITVQAGGNRIFGNEIEGSGCCYTGIWVEGSSSGNLIGGDTAESENVITGFDNGSIRITAAGNEVGRNRGSGGSEFLHAAGSTPAPTIVTAQQPKVTGTAEPGATVRVFTTQSEFLNEIEGFAGQATADLSGKWEVGLVAVPVGRLVTATETHAGETSGLSATVAVTPEPPPSGGGSGTGGGGGSGENGGGTTGGGGSTGDNGSSQSGPTASAPAPTPAAPHPTAAVTKITKGPARSSKATTAKFTFKATPAAGAKFECKLDGKKFAKCASPKAYKKLKRGRHSFQVRASANGLTGAVAKFKFTVKP